VRDPFHVSRAFDSTAARPIVPAGPAPATAIGDAPIPADYDQRHTAEQGIREGLGTSSLTEAQLDFEVTPLMFAANTYLIRPAREADEPALRRLAFLDSSRPLIGRILVGEIDGVPAAAISLDERRTIADPFQRSGALRTHLRLRADALEAYAREPSLADRLRAAMRRRAVVRSAFA
jgi:hypothetical protein